MSPAAFDWAGLKNRRSERTVDYNGFGPALPVKVNRSPVYCPKLFASNSSGREASNQIVFSS